jgi:multiple sugar transport system permease protein
MTVADRTVVAQRAESRPASAMLGPIVRYVFLTFFALIFIMPFVLSLLGTFKSNGELTAYPPSFLPREWDFSNWPRVWNFTLPSVGSRLLPLWFWNSSWLAIVNVVFKLFFCSLVAYAFARIPFPFKNTVFTIMLATMAIPAAVTLLPGYVFFTRLGWVNTFWPLIIPRLIDVGGIYMLTQAFRSIPKELEEAAFLDGLGRFGTYWRVALPLIVPTLITFAILQFQGSWNDYLTPLLFLQKPDIMTLPIGMGFFKGQFSSDYSAQMVGAMLNAIPVLILFFFFNRYYTGSASYSGLAGQ